MTVRTMQKPTNLCIERYVGQESQDSRTNCVAPPGQALELNLLVRERPRGRQYNVQNQSQ